MTGTTHHITPVVIPNAVLKLIDELIEKQFVLNRSEYIRNAVIRQLKLDVIVFNGKLEEWLCALLDT